MDESPDEDFLTDEERSRIALLTEDEIAGIDQALLSRCDNHWRKVAFVVGFAMHNRVDRGVPDIFYSQRVRILVERGMLESAGNLSYMRYSEVRRAQPGRAG